MARFRRSRKFAVVGAVLTVVGGVLLTLQLRSAPSATIDVAVTQTTTTSVSVSSSSLVEDETVTTQSVQDQPQPLSETGLEARRGHSVIATDTDVLVWGGWSSSRADIVFGDGARLDLASGEWAPIAAAPIALGFHQALWTGEEMIVVGGQPAFLEGSHQELSSSS